MINECVYQAKQTTIKHKTTKRIHSFMSKKETYNSLIDTVTQEYLDTLDQDATPKQIEYELLEQTNIAIQNHNLGPRDMSVPDNAKETEKYPNALPRDERFKKIKTLTPFQIASIFIHHHTVCCISRIDNNTSTDYDMIAMYQTEGPDEGIYITEENVFRTLIRQYNKTISSRDSDEVLAAIKDLAPKRKVNHDRDLVAVNNGIFDYAKKELFDFNPEWVFTSKSHVNYVENAPNPTITNPDDNTSWDVQTWLDELSDDPEIVNLLWQIIGAIIRPNVSWNKSAWLYSETGNNGKGTLCTLMRNICGPKTYASIPLKDFSNEFMLEPLIHASAIIVDENDVGTYIDQAANLKAIITNDVISINRKYKTPVVYQFHGFMVQCMNEFPRVRDRSDSFYRRQLFIPFDKRFEGKERKYIKDDYLNRQDVLEYVLWHVLGETDYYELDIPQSCTDILNDYKISNDPVREFFLYFQENAVWSFYPNELVYKMYSNWMRQNCPHGSELSQNKFIRTLKMLTYQPDSKFMIEDENKKVYLSTLVSEPEPMIVDLDIQDWQAQTQSRTTSKRAMPPKEKLDKRYRGFTRKPDNTIITEAKEL